MSTDPTPIPFIINPQPAPRGPESFEQKAKRKFKEQPLVPIGAGLTCFALIYAIVRQRQGRSRDMNKWLWARIAFQGLTVAAVVGGSFAMGTTKQQVDAREAAQQEAALHDERAGFEARMKAAEEAHAVETHLAGMSSKSDGLKKEPPAGVALLRSAQAASGPPGSEPAGVQAMDKMSTSDSKAKSWWSWGK